MRSLGILISALIIILMLTTPTNAAVENLYVEEIEGHHYLDGEVMRFSTEREFTIKDYELFDRTIGNEEFPYVNITYTSPGEYGTYKTITEPREPANFNPSLTFWDDGTLKNVEWDVRLFRMSEIPNDLNYVFGGVADRVFGDGSIGSKRVDLIIEDGTFTLALQHYEYKIVDGEMQKLRVNTEMTTDNNEDGLIIRSALHIIKRTPDETIVFEYGQDTKRVDQLSRVFNILDQPFLWVPYQLGAIFLMVYIYIRVTRYLQENNIKIIREAPEETSTEEIEESEDETTV